MADSDLWAGLVNPRTALARVRQAAGTLASNPKNFSQTGYNETVEKSEACNSFSHSSHFSRGAVSLEPPSHDSRKEELDLSSSSISKTYAISAPPAGLPDPDPERLAHRAPAKPAKRLKQRLTRSDHSTIALASPARAFAVTNTVPSPTAHLHGPQEWRNGLAKLDRWTPPCDGFRSGEWEAVHRGVAHFMDHCAVEAAARGWTAIDLFGVHGRAGAARVDSCGALMLPWHSSATLIGTDAIAFGPLVYRRRPMPEAVLAWDYLQQGQPQ